jgi:hypothetical protein
MRGIGYSHASFERQADPVLAGEIIDFAPLP